MGSFCEAVRWTWEGRGGREGGTGGWGEVFVEVGV